MAHYSRLDYNNISGQIVRLHSYDYLASSVTDAEAALNLLNNKAFLAWLAFPCFCFGYKS